MFVWGNGGSDQEYASMYLGHIYTAVPFNPHQSIINQYDALVAAIGNGAFQKVYDLSGYDLGTYGSNS